MYKFEKLEVYQLALTYTDMIYTLVEKLPREGSTSQSDLEQRRFLGMAIRSLIETVACQQFIRKRRYVAEEELEKAYDFSQTVFAKLQAMRRSLLKSRTET